MWRSDILPQRPTQEFFLLNSFSASLAESKPETCLKIGTERKKISNWKVSAPQMEVKNMAKNIKGWLSFDPWSNSFFRLGKPNLKSASVLNWKIVLSQEICHWPRRFHWNSLFMLLLLSNFRMIPRTWLGCYSGCIVSVMRCRTVMRDYPLPAQPNPQQSQGHIEEQGWN